MTSFKSIELDLLAARIEHYNVRLTALRSSLSALHEDTGRIIGELAADARRLERIRDGLEAGAAGRYDEASGHASRLTRIKGIDAETAVNLARLGLSSFEQIAALTEGDIAEVGSLIGDRRRIAKENWIEQAAMLSDGGTTAYARATGDAGEAAAPLEPSASSATGAQPAPLAPGATILAFAARLDTGAESPAGAGPTEPAGDVPPSAVPSAEAGDIAPAIEPLFTVERPEPMAIDLTAALSSLEGKPDEPKSPDDQAADANADAGHDGIAGLDEAPLPTNDVAPAADAGDAGHGALAAAPVGETAVPPATGAETASAAAPTTSVGRIIDLEARRQSRRSVRRRALGAVASLVVVLSASAAFNDVLRSEIGARLLSLTSCDSVTIATHRDCAVLAWFSL